MVDGGVRVAEPSTIVDMTGSYPKVIRQGKVINVLSFSDSIHLKSLTSLWVVQGPILPWMVVEDNESHLPQDLVASGT